MFSFFEKNSHTFYKFKENIFIFMFEDSLTVENEII